MIVRTPTREDGYLPLSHYGALGEGRSIALSGEDGSIDWWCVPNMDSPPLFDRLVNPVEGGRFCISPVEPFSIERRYRDGSNVLETVFKTARGRAVMVESLNSGPAGRMPWCELGRRIEGVEGSIEFALDLRFGTRADTCSPYLVERDGRFIFHAGSTLGVVLASDGITFKAVGEALEARFTIGAAERKVFALVAGDDEPLVVPNIGEIDIRIDVSDQEWRDWSTRIGYDGERHEPVLRSALALKLLLYSPSGAIAAAATSSLPEKIGGPKNYDYRYAWVRDAGYIIKAFLIIGADAEAKAAFTWLIKRIAEHGARVFYKLDGALPPIDRDVDVPGYRNSQPVRLGNAAASQHQHGIYGDIFEVAFRFVADGNILDDRTAETLERLANECAERWRQKDSGMWELELQRHYTVSKISCWQALNRAVFLAENGHIPMTHSPRWRRERDRIAEWIDGNCWSEAKGAYTAWPGTEDLDAALALAVRFDFDGREKLSRTIDAIDRELGAGPFHYRMSGMAAEEGCFLACSFWIVEAKSLLGRAKDARKAFDALLEKLDSCGIYPEMIDPNTLDWLGNLPQGFTHLAMIHAATALDGKQEQDR
jgi:GH15 family glucan-1,4-alpha-glucosidase